VATARTKAKRSASAKPANAQAARIEWIAGIVSAAIVLAVMGFLAFEAVVKSGGIADLAVIPVERGMTQAGLAVTFEVRNAGHAAAAAVEVAGGDGQITIDYVPAGASRMATLIFPPETSPEEIEVRVVGYSDP
jgi:uncharacterized protein (TIGR02588 family)